MGKGWDGMGCMSFQHGGRIQSTPYPPQIWAGYGVPVSPDIWAHNARSGWVGFSVQAVTKLAARTFGEDMGPPVVDALT